jgi:Flp pilus assembly pilin Flp
MLNRFCDKTKKGVALLEYSILVSALILALIAVQTTLRRALSSRWKAAADGTFGSGRQYDPGTTTVTVR